MVTSMQFILFLEYCLYNLTTIIVWVVSLMDYKAIGKRIKSMRKLQDISQEKLAEYGDISTVHMSHIETGKTKLSLPVIVAIADALNVSVDALIYDEPRGGASIAVDEIAAVLASCDAVQARIISDVVKATKQSLDAHMK